jgi:hypothetical protein
MKIKIPTYKIQRILDSEAEIEIPDEVMYLFEIGIRRSMKVEIEMTTWNTNVHNKPEEFNKIIVTIVYNAYKLCIEQKIFDLSDISSAYEKGSGEAYDLLNFIFNKDNYDIRTEQQFNTDFELALNKIKKIDVT